MPHEKRFAPTPTSLLVATLLIYDTLSKVSSRLISLLRTRLIYPFWRVINHNRQHGAVEARGNKKPTRLTK